MRLCTARSRARTSLRAWARYRSSSRSCYFLGLQSPRATSRAACLLEGGAVSRQVERGSHGPRALLPRPSARASVRKARLQCITSRRAKVRSSGGRASRSQRVSQHRHFYFAVIEGTACIAYLSDEENAAKAAPGAGERTSDQPPASCNELAFFSPSRSRIREAESR